MAITLVTTNQPARTVLRGIGTVTVPDGRKLKMDVPSVEDIFNDGPPVGKQWRVVIDMTVEETDA